MLIREAQGKEESRKMLAKNMELLTSVIVKVVETADSWKNKKVSKTIQAVNLFTKAAKVLVHSSKGAEVVNKLNKCGMQLVKAIEDACEKDKSMSNLKGKQKEIKTIITHAWSYLF